MGRVSRRDCRVAHRGALLPGAKVQRGGRRRGHGGDGGYPRGVVPGGSGEDRPDVTAHETKFNKAGLGRVQGRGDARGALRQADSTRRAEESADGIEGCGADGAGGLADGCRVGRGAGRQREEPAGAAADGAQGR